VTEPAQAETEAAHEEDEELESEPTGDGAKNESQSASAEESAAGWAIRGAVIGAIVGGAAGAGAGFLFAKRPEMLRQTGETLRGSGGQVTRAAASAASEVVTSRGLTKLIAANGTDDRSQLVKQTAMEAGAEAAKAARDAIVSLRREAA